MKMIERMSTKTRFEREAWGNSEMAKTKVVKENNFHSDSQIANEYLFPYVHKSLLQGILPI